MNDVEFHNVRFPHSPVLATLGQRFLGQFLDGFVPLVVIIPGAILVSITDSVVFIVIAAIAGFAYFFFADGLGEGQSFGKRAAGTRVIDSRTGEPCTYWQSLLRNFLGILGIFDWIFIFGESRQRLGDKAAGTIVVKA